MPSIARPIRDRIVCARTSKSAILGRPKKRFRTRFGHGSPRTRENKRFAIARECPFSDDAWPLVTRKERVHVGRAGAVDGEANPIDGDEISARGEEHRLGGDAISTELHDHGLRGDAICIAAEAFLIELA